MLVCYFFCCQGLQYCLFGGICVWFRFKWQTKNNKKKKLLRIFSTKWNEMKIISLCIYTPVEVYITHTHTLCVRIHLYHTRCRYFYFLPNAFNWSWLNSGMLSTVRCCVFFSSLFIILYGIRMHGYMRMCVCVCVCRSVYEWMCTNLLYL